MKKVIALVALVFGVIVLLGAGYLAYSFLRTPETASQPIEAIPLTVEATEAETAAEAALAAESEAQAEAEVEAQTETEANAETEIQAEAATEMETEAEAEAEAEAAGGEEAEIQPEPQANNEGSASPLIFEIVPAQSEARFLIDEVLRGDPITVVGSTDQIAGQFAVDPADLSTAQVGVIQVNARTLATDNDFRNRAIKNRILLTDQHEFITFNPTQVVGLPEQGTVGETYNFQVEGELTVTGVTQLVTFDVTATPTGEGRIEGTASTSFLYADFNLFIPDVQAVETVDDEVRLQIDFVAEGV